MQVRYYKLLKAKEIAKKMHFKNSHYWAVKLSSLTRLLRKRNTQTIILKMYKPKNM